MVPFVLCVARLKPYTEVTATKSRNGFVDLSLTFQSWKSEIELSCISVRGLDERITSILLKDEIKGDKKIYFFVIMY
jgi:hypothetical protein